MSSRELAAWRDQLAQILEAAADLTNVLGVVQRSGELHSPEYAVVATDSEVRTALGQIVAQVRDANEAAEQMLAAAPNLAKVVHPLLCIPGEKPVVDLRPWWSKLLDRVSSTAKRATLAQRLDTLRLEADDALMRAMVQLARLATVPPG